MADTVYLLGAGINRNLSITDYGPRPDRVEYTARPPLATDFFKQLLKYRPVATQPDTHRTTFNQLYDYIERYWRLSFDDLKEARFNLEECFTMVQQQRSAVYRDDDFEEYRRLSRIENELVELLRHFLSRFDYRALGPKFPPEPYSPGEYTPGMPQGVTDFQALCRLIVEESAAVLTLNYDLLLEAAIEEQSGNQSVKGNFDEYITERGLDPNYVNDVRYSFYNWKMPLAHAIKFDEVQTSWGWVPAESYYAPQEHELYDPPLLKLHGSLNWSAYTRFRQDNYRGLVEDNERAGMTLIHGSPNVDRWEPGNPVRAFHDSWLIEPLIITPVLNKNLSKKPFPEIWRRAREELAKCNRLVIGGLSFAPTDFAIRQLFREAFVDHTPAELVVINPDTSVVELVKDLCHYQQPVLVCGNLGEFIAANH